MDGEDSFYSWTLHSVKNSLSRTLKSSNNVPKHVGFVMDGNRRFARKNGMQIKEGHEAGFLSMSKILELCYEAGVVTATVYAFSIENFKRGPSEVSALMKLARKRIRQLTEHGELAQKYGIKIRVIGDLSLLDDELLNEIKLTTKMTENNNRAVLNICFPYTSRDEMLHSIKENISLNNIEKKKKNCNNNIIINESAIDEHLYTGNLPPLDLLIRTSGVCRFSDFLLWQVCNKNVTVELVDCLWPEFGPLRMAWILLKFIFKKTFNTKNNYLMDYDDDNNIIENKIIKDHNNKMDKDTTEIIQHNDSINTKTDMIGNSKNNNSKKEKLQ